MADAFNFNWTPLRTRFGDVSNLNASALGVDKAAGTATNPRATRNACSQMYAVTKFEPYMHQEVVSE